MKGLVENAQPAIAKMAVIGGGKKSAYNMVRYASREAVLSMARENGQKITKKEQQNAILEEGLHYYDKREPSKDVVTLSIKSFMNGRDLQSDPRTHQKILTTGVNGSLPAINELGSFEKALIAPR